MSGIEYSQDAFLSRPVFYGSKIVYVEGEDDIPFWSEIFRKLNFECEIQELNGVKNVIKRLPGIISDGSGYNFLAIDGDYRKYVGNTIESNHVFVTPCYGIENIMFCKPKAIQNAFNLNARKKLCKYDDEISQCIKMFKELFFDMCCVDMLNEILKKGECILKCSFARFYCKKLFFSEDKIKTYSSDVAKKFTDEELRAIEKFKHEFDDNFFKDVRCHFLESFFQHVIRHVINERGMNLSELVPT